MFEVSRLTCKTSTVRWVVFTFPSVKIRSRCNKSPLAGIQNAAGTELPVKEREIKCRILCRPLKINQGVPSLQPSRVTGTCRKPRRQVEKKRCVEAAFNLSAGAVYTDNVCKYTHFPHRCLHSVMCTGEF